MMTSLIALNTVSASGLVLYNHFFLIALLPAGKLHMSQVLFFRIDRHFSSMGLHSYC